MIAPEERIADVPGVKLDGSEVLSEQPRCVRVRLLITRENREYKQTAIFLNLPAGDGYSLVPVTAGATAGNSTARLSDILAGWKKSCGISGSAGGSDGDIIGAVNGGYFIFVERLWCRASRFYPEHTRVGDAIGWLMTEGETRYPPLYGRAAYVTSADGRSRVVRADMTHVSVEFRDSERTRAALSAEFINTPHPESVVCYTPDWPGNATPRRRGATEVALIGNTVAAVDRNGGTPIPVNGCVISAVEPAWNDLDARDLRVIENVSYVLNEKGRSEFGDVRQAIEAGPALVAGGVPYNVDAAFLGEQGFARGTPPFPAFNSVLTHHRQFAPRVCIGITGGKDVTVALFEGRRPGESEGLTLSEAALFMAAAGCEEAVNLDGGASAEIILHGETLNSLALGAMDKKWLDRSLDFLNKRMKSGTIPCTEDLGGADERAVGNAIMIVSRG